MSSHPIHDFQYKKGELYCEGVKVSAIASKVGTPVYIYSYNTLVGHYRKIQQAFKSLDPVICFAMKANSNLAVLKALVKEGAGFDIVSGGTDNHLILADVTPLGLSGKEAEQALDEVGITVNKNIIPNDIRKPLDPSGIRLGTPALTTRGMKEPAMKKIGQMIIALLKNPHKISQKTAARKLVKELTQKFPLFYGV